MVTDELQMNLPSPAHSCNHLPQPLLWRMEGLGVIKKYISTWEDLWIIILSFVIVSFCVTHSEVIKKPPMLIKKGTFFF